MSTTAQVRAPITDDSHMRRLAIFFLALISLTESITAAEGHTTPMILTAGLPIEISVAALGPSAKDVGITEEFIEEVVELSLRRNKIPLVGDSRDTDCRAAIEDIPPGETRTLHECSMHLDAWLEMLTAPVFQVIVTVLDVRVGDRVVGYAYHVGIELSQLVALDPARQPNNVTYAANLVETITATTWEDGEIGIIGGAETLRKEIRHFLTEQTNSFSLDYLRGSNSPS